MTEFLANFHFIRPMWLLAALPALIAFVLLLKHQGRSSQWQKLIDPRFLPFLVDGKITPQRRLPVIALLCLWWIACVALAGPSWQKTDLPLQKEVSGLMILWDLSPSMNAQDVKPSRLVRSRLKLLDLLKQRKEGLTGLIAYAGDAHIVTPLTDDTRTIASQLAGLSPDIMPSRGSNVESAFQMAVNALNDGGISQGQIVILTDGIASDARPSLKSQATTSGHKVVIWGIGTRQGAPIPLEDGGFARDRANTIIVAKLDEETLSDVAQDTRGLYVPFSNDDLDINTLLNFGLNDTSTTALETKRSFDQWKEQGHWLALFMLPFAVFAFRRGWILSIILLIGFVPPKSYASGLQDTWQSLWQTQNQQAQEKLNEAPAEAADMFTRPEWQAAANYKAGQFDKAAQYYETQADAKEQYNYANALTQMGKYDDAIAAYDKALKQDPSLAEAEHNKAIAQKLKQLQEQQQQDGQQQDGQQQDGQQQDGQQQDGQQQDGQQQDGQQQDGQQQDGQQQDGQQQDGQQQDGQQQDGQQQNGQQQNATEDQQKALDEQYSQSQEKAEETPEQAKQNEAQKAKGENPEQDAQNAEQQMQAMQQAEGDQQQGEPKEGEMQAIPQMQEQEYSEEQQALEQWLRRVPDDPSGLLRNKFEYEHNQRLRELRSRQLRNPNSETQERW